MRQFGKILKFELKNYFTNKVFVGVTLFLAVAIAVVMFFPRIMDSFQQMNSFQQEESNTTTDINTDLSLMLIAGEYGSEVYQTFSEAFVNYEVELDEGDIENVKKRIMSGEVACAFVIDSLTSYTYYVNNLSMYDSNTAVADEVLQSIYRMSAMMEEGISAKQAGEILSMGIHHETMKLGKDQMENFLYTYIMIFALYMVILLYGQMVATNVATEKSSRAMEVLITSAKPASMMFGKVIASCLAGFIQLVVVFGTALISYHFNKEYLDETGMIASMFNMPVDLFVYMLIFFVLGFLMYAFMYGAVGSTASKLEDINTSVMPITMLFVVGFMVVMFSMTAGNVDTVLMKVCSFIPFTSPMAMFTRIAMTTVPFYEIVISIILLVASVIGIGLLSAKIYRVGVLLYGTPPKPGAIIKAIRKA